MRIRDSFSLEAVSDTDIVVQLSDVETEVPLTLNVHVSAEEGGDADTAEVNLTVKGDMVVAIRGGDIDSLTDAEAEDLLAALVTYFPGLFAWEEGDPGYEGHYAEDEEDEEDEPSENTKLSLDEASVLQYLQENPVTAGRIVARLLER